MNPLRLAVLGIAAYAAFLVATMPAAMLASPAAAASKGQIRLSDPGGTVWNGTARVTVSTGSTSFELDEVRWRFLPMRLLSGRAAFLVDARLGDWAARLEAARSPLAWQASDLRAGGDASVLATIFPMASVWQPGGTIALVSERLAWDGKGASGTATAEWRDATLAVSEARPLGSWRAQGTADGEALRITLSTLGGPLQLTGNGTLGIDGRLALSGQARAEPGRERELETVLGLVGPRRADGAHAIEIR